MIGGLVEIAEDGRHLSVHRGFLVVREEAGELGRVPLADISAVILAANQITLSKQLLIRLAEAKAVLVTCGGNYHPASMTIPYSPHHEAAGILNDQIQANAPLQKRLWQRLVQAKIATQAAILARHKPGHAKLAELATLGKRVRSGDPDNIEAQAARHYWPALMDTEFRRDRHAEDANVYLNYGYTVLRAATARAVCGAGLHPGLGLHHGSRGNPFALVDDLMEPFRPHVDSIAHALGLEAREEGVEDGERLDPETKRRLASVLQLDLLSSKGASPLINCLARLAISLATSLREGREMLDLPEVTPPGKLL